MDLVKHGMDENFRYLELSIVKDTCESSILVVCLSRPKKHNALNSHMWREIEMIFRNIGISPDYSPCRCVLLMGSGNSFCSGIDFSDPNFMSPLQDTSNQSDVARKGFSFQSKLKDMQQAFTAIEDCPVPVVSAMHGSVIGAGIDLCTATQIRLCTSQTKFSVKEVALGLAADVGTLQRLPKVCGNQSLVHELCYTGRLFSAQEALQIGLVSRVVDGSTPQQLIREALSICVEIARHSPLAVRGTKQSLLFSRDHSVREGLDHIASYNLLALQSPDVHQAILATKKREPARFPDMLPYSRL